MPERARLVYSTASGRICPECQQPAGACGCADAGKHDALVPDRLSAVLRLETKGRGGKAVTVIDRLPENTVFLQELATALKRSCATGGTVRTGAIELAGDVRDRVRPLLAKRGFTVKG